MQNRKNLGNKAKKIAKVTSQGAANFLSIGAATTNFMVAVAPKFVRSHICEIAPTVSTNPFLNRLNAVTVADMGNYLFLTSGSIRAFLIPSVYFAGKQLYLVFSEKFSLNNNPSNKEILAQLKQFEKTAISSINTYSFIQNTPIFDNVNLTKYVSAVSVTPLIHTAGEIIQKQYYNLEKPSKTEQEQKNKERCRFILDGLNKLSIVTSTAASARSFGNFICDFFVDSTENQDWKNQNLMLDLVLCSAALIALGLVVKGGNRAESLLKQAAFCTGMFTTITLSLFSFYLCINPSNEDTNTFWQKNWLSFIITCSAGILAASLMRYSMKDNFKPATTSLNNVTEELHKDKKEKTTSQKNVTPTGFSQQYGTFSTVNSDEKQSESSDSEKISSSNFNSNIKPNMGD